jgi:hypothetical protein
VLEQGPRRVNLADVLELNRRDVRKRGHVEDL